MTRQLFTASRRALSSILVVWMSLVVLGPFVHDVAGHDLDGAPVLVLHDPSHHRIGAAPFAPPRGDTHCVVCHFFCGSRYTESPSVGVHLALRLSFAPGLEDNGRLITAALRQIPARGPPAYS